VIEGVKFNDGIRADDNTELTQQQDAAWFPAIHQIWLYLQRCCWGLELQNLYGKINPFKNYVKPLIWMPKKYHLTQYFEQAIIIL
jgi:hypothetical protein